MVIMFWFYESTNLQISALHRHCFPDALNLPAGYRTVCPCVLYMLPTLSGLADLLLLPIGRCSSFFSGFEVTNTH